MVTRKGEWFGPCGGSGVVVPIEDMPIRCALPLPARGKVCVQLAYDAKHNDSLKEQ